MTPSDSSAALRRAVDDALPLLQGASDTQTVVRPAPGKWCAREVLGHLIDSACNNHRRFVLGHAGQTPRWDGYEQDHWVSSQQYASERWMDLVELWAAYNRHLAHVMAATTAATAAHEATSPDGGRQLSVGFLMSDYVSHLDHHLDQLRDLLQP
jgi:hypothetical protein